MITIKEVDDWVLDIPFKREYREFLEDDDGDAQDWLETPPEVEA